MSDVKRYWHKPKIGFAVLDPQYYEDESGYVAYEDYAALEAELAKLKGEYEWVASINTALDESNQSAWDELARLRAGQEPVAYQCREIGEGDWADCDKKWFDYCERTPLHDTRKLYTTPQPSAVPEEKA